MLKETLDEWFNSFKERILRMYSKEGIFERSYEICVKTEMYKYLSTLDEKILNMIKDGDDVLDEIYDEFIYDAGFNSIVDYLDYNVFDNEYWSFLKEEE